MSQKSPFEGRSWLFDSPLYIDDRHIDQLYDSSIRLPHNHDQAANMNGVDLADFDCNNYGFDVIEERERPQQKLFQLEEVYNDLAPGSIHFKDNPKGVLELSRDKSTIPKPLVFLDLPPGEELSETSPKNDDGEDGDEVKTENVSDNDGGVNVIFMPTAAEFEENKMVHFYQKFESKTAEMGNTIQADTADSWNDLSKWFQVSDILKEIENGVETGGRINWIDFRLPIPGEDSTIHVHFMPDGKYDISVFAYNFVNRAFDHGIRLVGTLKSGADINVLAMYDK